MLQRLHAQIAPVLQKSTILKASIKSLNPGIPCYVSQLHLRHVIADDHLHVMRWCVCCKVNSPSEHRLHVNGANLLTLVGFAGKYGLHR